MFCLVLDTARIIRIDKTEDDQGGYGFHLLGENPATISTVEPGTVTIYTFIYFTR